MYQYRDLSGRSVLWKSVSYPLPPSSILSDDPLFSDDPRLSWTLWDDLAPSLMFVDLPPSSIVSDELAPSSIVSHDPPPSWISFMEPATLPATPLKSPRGRPFIPDPSFLPAEASAVRKRVQKRPRVRPRLRAADDAFHAPGANKPPPFSRPFTELLESIYEGYQAGDSYAPYNVTCSENAENVSRIDAFLERNAAGRFVSPGTPGIDPRSTCARGRASMKRILNDLDGMGSNFNWSDIDQLGVRLARQVHDLRDSCNKLDYLLRLRHPSSTMRSSIEHLLESVKASAILEDIERYGFRYSDFPRLYTSFCEQVKNGDDTTETIHDLRKLAKGDLDRATERVKQFADVRETYDKEKRDLNALMQEKSKAALTAGYPAAVISPEESRPVLEEVNTIDIQLAQIGETLQRSQEYWERVDQSLKPTIFRSRRTVPKDPPDGITTGPAELRIKRQADGVHRSLKAVHRAGQRHRKSKQTQRMGGQLVKHAANFTTNCAGIVHAQSLLENELQGPNPNNKNIKRALSPLKQRLSAVVTRHTKLSVGFEKYAQDICLFFWFATKARKVEKFDHIAHALLTSKGLSSHLLPFESVFLAIERQFCDIQRFWKGLDSLKDELWEKMRI
ncbi:hypothetical protein B0H16DRAFT_1583246 [Mycena metata]|uniref:Uncharacterized protein n=1 Tax=Mycena metata TaxID=1033252 RepID=A0AAD7MT74_9AGAR|nr:hypothetical protein B0H16DRAFT_1583246 [Mycena metata]